LFDDSAQSQIAKMAAAKAHIPVVKFNFLSLSWLDWRLKKFLIKREYRQKLKQFRSQVNSPRPSRQNVSQAIFLSVDFYRHLKTLLPLYQKLLQKKANVWLVTDDPNLTRSLSALGINNARILYLGSFFKPARSAKKISDPQTKTYLNFVRPLVDEGLRLSFVYWQAVQNLFAYSRPKRVVVVSDLRFAEQALALAAKKNRIPSLLVSPNSLLSRDALNEYQTTDQVALVGRYIQEKLIKQGVPADKITVVGDLQAETYQVLDKKINRREIYRQLGIKDMSKKIILAISFRANPSIPQAEKDLFLQWTDRAVTAIPRAVLVVKPHPTEKPLQLKEELKRLNLHQVIVADNQKLSLMALLKIASVVVETWSMTIFEAISAGKPVVCVNPFNKNYNLFLPIIGYGGAIEVNNKQDLTRWLKILTDKENPLTVNQLKKAEKAKSYFISEEPDPSQRVIELLRL